MSPPPCHNISKHPWLPTATPGGACHLEETVFCPVSSSGPGHRPAPPPREQRCLQRGDSHRPWRRPLVAEPSELKSALPLLGEARCPVASQSAIQIHKALGTVGENRGAVCWVQAESLERVLTVLIMSSRRQSLPAGRQGPHRGPAAVPTRVWSLGYLTRPYQIRVWPWPSVAENSIHWPSASVGLGLVHTWHE